MMDQDACARSLACGPSETIIHDRNLIVLVCHVTAVDNYNRSNKGALAMDLRQ